nr:DUF1376 domain-containing protein [uncultured Cupriavidus sp.]
MARVKEKRADVWMPLYISDYLADTSHLSAAEHGAYLLMLMHAWVNQGRLPVDDERLRRIARMDSKDWRDSGAELRGFFYEQDSALRHHRVDAELERANANISQRSKAGKASAEARRIKRDSEQNGNGCSTDVGTNVERMNQRGAERDGKPSPPPSPNTIPTSSGVGTSHGVGAVDNPAPPPLSADAIGEQLVLLEAERGKTLSLSSRAREALLRIAERCIDVPVLLRAHALACARRVADGDTSPVNPGFLGMFIDDALADRQGGAPPGADWDATPEGVQAKADALGVERDPDEHAIVFRMRVIAASGDHGLIEREVSKAERMNPGEFERVYRIMYGVLPGQVVA